MLSFIDTEQLHDRRPADQYRLTQSALLMDLVTEFWRRSYYVKNSQPGLGGAVINKLDSVSDLVE